MQPMTRYKSSKLDAVDSTITVTISQGLCRDQLQHILKWKFMRYFVDTLYDVMTSSKIVRSMIFLVREKEFKT